MATQRQFLDLLANIEPSPSTIAACSSAQNNLRNCLEENESFAEHHIGTFLSGSYARDTAIRPRIIDGELQRPDVDIIVETSFTKTDAPATVLSKLSAALRECGYKSVVENRRSVTVSLASVEMDVVPTIIVGRSKYVGDKDTREWILTNPFGHTKWTTEINTKASARFKPLVKLFKWWRRENLPELRRPKGFILECLVARHMNYSEVAYEELFAKLLEEIRDKHYITALLGQIPFLEDPSVPGNNVFSNVTPEEFKIFHDKVTEHAKLVREAQDEEDENKQLAQWREIFGTFPSGSVAKSETSSLLQPATLLSGGLTFPSTPVVPNKPQGFA